MIEPIEYLNIMSRKREVKNSKYADVEDVEDGYRSKFHRYYHKHREESLAKKRIYYQQNKEIISAKNKLYRQANAEKIKEIQIKWRKENPEKVSLCNEKRRLDRLQKEQHAAQAVFLCLIDRIFMGKELLKDEEKALKQIKKDGLVRYLSKGANIDRKDIITDFAQYVGCDGVGSTSPAGLAIAISSAIKKAYGCSVQEMNEQQLISLIGVEESIAQAVKTGMAKQLPRFEIRNKIKDLINHAKQQHQIMTEW